MRTSKRVLYISAAIAAVLVISAVAFFAASPAFSRATILSLIAPAQAPTPPAGELIPLKSIDGLTSLNAEVQMDVNGLINGERARGDLNAVLTTNDQGYSRITVTGSLLGELTAQVGGSLVGLFTPSSVDIYKTPQGPYIVVNSLFPICVKPASPKAAAALEELSPQKLLSMLTNSDVARGKFIGEEKLNGNLYKHYELDGEAFLTAAQKSSNAKLKKFSESLWSAEDADLYVDSKGGYPAAYSGGFSGTYDPLKFEGDFDVQIELTGINTNTEVKLPSACKNPIIK